MWTGFLYAFPQKPEQLAREMCALDDSKEQLLKEGETWAKRVILPGCPT